MMNEHNTTQSSTPSTTNIQYGYSTVPFDLMNVQSMQTPPDLYSYYPANLYQPLGSFDEHKQWGTTDIPGNIPTPTGGALTFHPQIYTPSGIDIPRGPFDYPSPPPHGYTQYHPAFTPPPFPGPSPTGSSVFDLSWNPHNLSMPQHLQMTAAQSPLTPIGTSSASNEKASIYDDYSTTNSRMTDMLTQQINSFDLGNNNNSENRHQRFEHGNYGNASRLNVFSSKDQQTFLSNPVTSRSTPSSTLSTTSTGPKSYACVVSSDANNRSNNRPAQVSNRNVDQNSNQEYFNKTSQFPSGQGATGQIWSNHSGSANARNNRNQTSTNYNNNNTNDRRQNGPVVRENQEFIENLKRNHQYNPKEFDLSPKGARFFVIKSYSEDDVHRSIKYNIWCSTEHGNKRLDAAFREREGKGPIYLFFSVNASGHFCGMAEMMSPVDYEHQTDVWHMSNKWQGKFEVKWIYVKDVPNQQLRNIRLENNENKPVTNSRDTQEIPYEKGKLMLKTMHLYQDKTSIFDDFHYYESKQAEEGVKKPMMNDWKWKTTKSNQENRVD